MDPEPINSHKHNYYSTSFLIGLSLAISSSLFIGSSFIIKKIALRRISGSGNLRASAGGFGYLKQWLWWLGFITMGAGEAANLVAYAFAPAALVTPLGALSVLVAALLASKFLNESLNFIGKIGCFLCIVGSTITVIHSPKAEEITTMAELSEKLHDPLFIVYVVFVIIIYTCIKVHFGPKYGHSNVIVYLLLCSAIGSLTVVASKGVALGIRETISGHTNSIWNLLFWELIIVAAVCICLQMNYLNKSLDIFNTGIVTPVYYVMFTILVIIASAILYKEWELMEINDMVGSGCGFLIVITAVFMLNAFKDMNVSLRDIQFKSKKKRLIDVTNYEIVNTEQNISNNNLVRSV